MGLELGCHPKRLGSEDGARTNRRERRHANNVSNRSNVLHRREVHASNESTLLSFTSQYKAQQCTQ
jgi:hypothetical protein